MSLVQTADHLPEAQAVDLDASSKIELVLWDSLSAADNEWTSFEKEAVHSVFQRYEWLASWQEHVGQASGVKPLIAVGRSQGRTVFLWPLGCRQRGPFTIASWLGAENTNYNVGLWDPAYFESASKSEIEALFRRIGSEAGIDAFRLTNQPKTWLQQQHPLQQFSSSISCSTSYATELSSDFSAFVSAKRSKNARKKLNKKLRRLEEAGPVEFSRATTSDDVQQALDALVEQRGHRERLAGIPSIYSSQSFRNFTLSLLLKNLDLKQPAKEIYALKVGGIIRATYIGGAQGDRYSCYANSFRDDELTRYSPGTHLLMYVFERAIGAGYKTLDMGIGEESYKTEWCTPEDLFDTTIPISALGYPYAVMHKGKNSMKRFIRSSPRAWNAVRIMRKTMCRLGITC
ncbi:MAG: GNAT family N-acetyltransferase [Stappiaceae bacterium]